MISYLAEKTQGSTVYKTEFEDGFVLWRIIPWGEFKSLREARLSIGPSIDCDLEESIYRSAVFFSSFDRPPPPELSGAERDLFIRMDRENQDAGIISTVAKAILSASGVTKANKIFSQLDVARSLIGNIEDQMTVLICRAFPSYTPEDVEKMTWPTVLKRASQAEMILMGYSIELPIQPASNESPEDNQRQKLDKIISRVNTQSEAYLDEDHDADEGSAKEEAAKRRKEIAEKRAAILRQRGY